MPKRRRIRLRPIRKAPVRPGERFGPVLLADDRGWIVGRWDGRHWYDEEGAIRLHPTLYAPLPCRS